MLTQDEVKKIAELARIELNDAEIEKFQHDLSSVLEYVAALQEVNVDGVEEVSQVTGLINIQRQDEIVVAQNLDEIKAEAPETKDGYYKVKAIL